jgi:preprotein translocase subunit YajC
MPLAAALLFLFQNAPAGGAAPGGGAPPSGGAASGGGMSDMVFLVAALIGIMYFVVIRPANRERKRQAELMSSLKKGDRVLLSSGLIATVAALSEKEVMVKVDDKNPLRMRFQKQAIQTILKSDDAAPVEAVEAESK